MAKKKSTTKKKAPAKATSKKEAAPKKAQVKKEEAVKQPEPKKPELSFEQKQALERSKRRQKVEKPAIKRPS